MHPVFLEVSMKHINIGVIATTHALKGEVKVKCLTDFPDTRFQKGKNICMQTKQGQTILQIQNIRKSNELLIIKFAGYDHIEDVEGWKGNLLYIDESELHPLADDEAYYFEMQDSEVYDMQDVYIGKVIEVIETGANAVLRVEMAEGQVLIPFVKAFVKEFNKKEKIMKVEMMEGLV